MRSKRQRSLAFDCLDERCLLSSMLSTPNPLGTYSSKGTVSVRMTHYAIPSGAKFMATNGNDSNSGTQSSPWATLSHALGSTPSGGTIVMEGGTYSANQIYINSPVTIQAAPNSTVWFNGNGSAPFALDVNASNVKMLGIGFENYDTASGEAPGNDRGAVNTLSTGGVIENCTFAHDTGAGLDLGDGNTTINLCTFAFNGENGIGAWSDNGINITSSVFAYNNQFNYDTISTLNEAGAKLDTCINSTVKDCLFDSDCTLGLWTDSVSKNITVVGNTFLNNQAGGMYCEQTIGCVIASNVAVGNGHNTSSPLLQSLFNVWDQGGIIIADGANNVQVYNNTCVNNLTNIIVWDLPNFVGADGVTTGNIQIDNNILDRVLPGTEANLLTYHLVSGANVTANYNAYEQPTSGQYPEVSWLGSNYNTLSAFRSATGQESHGQEVF